MRRLVFWMVLFLVHNLAGADVPVRDNGIFRLSLTDLESTNGSGENVEFIWRYFHTMSNYRGTFGIGWCGPHEARIEIQEDGKLVSHWCGDSADEPYVPIPSDDVKNQARVVKTPLRSLKDVADGSRFAAWIPDNKGTGVFERNGDFFVHTRTKGGTRSIFDLSGRLIRHEDNGHKMEYVRDGDRLKEMVYDKKQKAIFEYKDGKLDRIRLGNQTAIYHFDGDKLVKVVNGWENEYNFKYNSKLNLTDILYPDGKVLKIDYDLKLGRTRKVVLPDGCTEEYIYKDLGPTEPDSAIAKRTCVTLTPRGYRR